MATHSAPARQLAVGRAPGKLIIVGEHAVVHGQPAIAFPFPTVSASVTACPAPGPLRLISPIWAGEFSTIDEVPYEVQGLGTAALAAIEHAGGAPEGLTLEVSSSIPLGSGLGSSASVAAALVRAILAAHGQTPDEATVLALTHRAEEHAHGNPSGVDAHAVVLGAPIRFVRGSGAQRLQVSVPLPLVVAHTGVPGDTREAVAAVQVRLEASEMLTRARMETLGALADMAMIALTDGSLFTLGAVMNEAHKELSNLGVSHPALDRLVETARGAGALGAKLTGAGRGGCMIALAPDKPTQQVVADALKKAGARQVWRPTQGVVEGPSA